jgi:hypothetical protein
MKVAKIRKKKPPALNARSVGYISKNRTPRKQPYVAKTVIILTVSTP